MIIIAPSARPSENAKGKLISIDYPKFLSFKSKDSPTEGGGKSNSITMSKLKKHLISPPSSPNPNINQLEIRSMS